SQRTERDRGGGATSDDACRAEATFGAEPQTLAGEPSLADACGTDEDHAAGIRLRQHLGDSIELPFASHQGPVGRHAPKVQVQERSVRSMHSPPWPAFGYIVR